MTARACHQGDEADPPDRKPLPKPTIDKRMSNTTQQQIGQLDNPPLSRYHEGISQSSFLRPRCPPERGIKGWDRYTRLHDQVSARARHQGGGKPGRQDTGLARALRLTDAVELRDQGHRGRRRKNRLDLYGLDRSPMPATYEVKTRKGHLKRA